MPTEKPRYTITVDEDLMNRIDDFRFENRYPSRSAATLELIRLGIEALQKNNRHNQSKSNTFIVNAAHERKGRFTKEERMHDEDIMNEKDF